jgi:hypothetical protein
MERSDSVVSAPGVQRHRRRRHSRVPLDAVLFLFVFSVVLPLGVHADWFRPAGRLPNAGETVLLGLALSFGLLGSILLVIARIPLYVRRHHHGFRPRELPENYRRLFWVAYVFILISAAMLLLLGAIQRCF